LVKNKIKTYERVKKQQQQRKLNKNRGKP